MPNPGDGYYRTICYKVSSRSSPLLLLCIIAHVACWSPAWSATCLCVVLHTGTGKSSHGGTRMGTGDPPLGRGTHYWADWVGQSYTAASLRMSGWAPQGKVYLGRQWRPLSPGTSGPERGQGSDISAVCECGCWSTGWWARDVTQHAASCSYRCAGEERAYGTSATLVKCSHCRARCCGVLIIACVPIHSCGVQGDGRWARIMQFTLYCRAIVSQWRQRNRSDTRVDVVILHNRTAGIILCSDTRQTIRCG